MITKDFIFSLLGGLGFFFFGMRLMSEGLKKIAGERLKAILYAATKFPILGVLMGAGVTCLIQSSSATSVMVVGFVNAGLLPLRQGISVIMGANIGTTFTAWLVSAMSVFKISHYALPLVAIGFVANTFAKTKNAKFWGQVILGFGVLFVGLGLMKEAFGPLKESGYVKDIFANFGANPILGVLAGMIFTMLLQSSSATIAIVQVLAFSGVISFPAAIPIVLGDNIGTTITAELSAIGTNTNARRVARSHCLFNIIGVGYMLFFVYTGLFERLIYFIIPGELSLRNIMFYIAVAHSMFNIANTLVFLPFIGVLERLCVRMIPKAKGMVEPGPQYLEKHLLETPSIAIIQAKNETVRMLKMAARSVGAAAGSFFKNNLSELSVVSKLEEAVDNLQSEITQYLIELSQRNLSPVESEELPVLIHIVNDVERIGDHSENILELSQRKIEKKLPFSKEAIDDLDAMWQELDKMMHETAQALDKVDSKLAHGVLEREAKINQFQRKLKKSHVNRLNKGICDLKAGVVFLDFVDNMEKIGDHLCNIAQGVIGQLRWKAHKESLIEAVEK